MLFVTVRWSGVIIHIVSLIAIWNTIPLNSAMAGSRRTLPAPTVQLESDNLGFIDVAVAIHRKVKLHGLTLRVKRWGNGSWGSYLVHKPTRKFLLIDGPMNSGSYSYRVGLGRRGLGYIYSPAATVSVELPSEDLPGDKNMSDLLPGRPTLPAGMEECGGPAFYQEAYARLNAYRNQAGVASLVFGEQLYFAALAHNISMAQRGLMTHDGFNQEIMAYEPAARSFGQIIATTIQSPSGVEDAWFSSPSHHALMLNANYARTGVACLIDRRVNPPTTWWTEDFAD